MNKGTKNGYENSYIFMQKFLEDRNVSKENYLDYWNNHHAHVTLTDINESNRSFSIIIDFDELSIPDLVDSYSVGEDNYQWYIKNKTQKILKHFDDWKTKANAKLYFSNGKKINGLLLLYSRPRLKPLKIKKEIKKYDTKVYVQTEEGRFYLTQYSLNKLLENDLSHCSWIYETDEYKDNQETKYYKILNKDGNILQSTNKKITLGKDCKARLFLPNPPEKKHKWHTEALGTWYQNNDGFFVTIRGKGTTSFYNQEIPSNHECKD